MVRRFLDMVLDHPGPWFDDLARRPVQIRDALSFDSVVVRSGRILVVDLFDHRNQWERDYQCVRPITEMEAVAYAAAEAQR
jgi:hypothetical protein